MSEVIGVKKASSTALFAGLLMLVAGLTGLLWPAGSSAGFGAGGADSFAVSVQKTGGGEGLVTSSPEGINCGIDCEGLFPGGAPVTLTATPARGSRFVGWGGACAIHGMDPCPLSPPSTGGSAPIPIPAGFERIPPPTAKLQGKAKPRLVRVRVGCGDDGPPCTLRVSVLLRFWLSKKGYDYYKAGSERVSIKADGIVHRDLAMRTGASGDRMIRALKRSPGRKGAIRVVVENPADGTAMSIVEKGVCNCIPKKDKNTKNTR
jgi:hypothetical protein